MEDSRIKQIIEDVNFHKMGGLVPVIVQDASTDSILMQAFMNSEALRLTLKTGKMHFWSRTKNRIWMKGEKSGNCSIVQRFALDCDSDSILFQVQQIGPCCHTGKDSCFQSIMTDQNIIDGRILDRIFEIVRVRIQNQKEGSYVSRLSLQGIDSILQKIGEENMELVLSAKNGDSDNIVSETSDLLFHIMVLFAEKKIDFKECFRELRDRHYAKTKPSE